MEDNRSDLTIAQAFEKLENIIEQMQSQELSLEEMFTLYKNGISLVDDCSSKIDKIQTEVVKLSGSENPDMPSSDSSLF